MKSLEEIRKIINEYRHILNERFKISSIITFGSYVRRKEQEKSDFDVLVDFYETIDLFEFEDFLSQAIAG